MKEVEEWPRERLEKLDRRIWDLIQEIKYDEQR